jgi:hypothetical protein
MVIMASFARDYCCNVNGDGLSEERALWFFLIDASPLYSATLRAISFCQCVES